MVGGRYVLSCVLGLGLFTSGVAGATESDAYFDDEVLVQYKSEAGTSAQELEGLYEELGVTAVRRLKAGLRSRVERLYLKEGTDVQAVIAELERDPRVEYAQPNYILSIPELADASADQAPRPCWFRGINLPRGCVPRGETDTDPALAGSPAETLPSQPDPMLSRTYGMGKIGAVDAWAGAPGSKTIIVADIDTGIDYNHEDLGFNLWRNPSPSAAGDVVGYDFVNGDGMPFDDSASGHGTHTAGTIGAVGGNGKGVSGVAPRVSLMALKFLSGKGQGSTADAIKAIDYAIDHGAKILNNSWGGGGTNRALEDAVRRALAKDVLFVAAAGNNSKDNDGASPSYPGAFKLENMVTVAATDATDQLAKFSNYGATTTHLAAPGVEVLSTIPGNKYKALSGTSMACPHVAGAAALIWSKNPTWTMRQVKAALLQSVDVVPALAGKTITGGRLNVLSALRAAPSRF